MKQQVHRKERQLAHPRLWIGHYRNACTDTFMVILPPPGRSVVGGPGVEATAPAACTHCVHRSQTLERARRWRWRSAVRRPRSLPIPPAPHVVQHPSTPVVPSRPCRRRGTLTCLRSGSCLRSRTAGLAAFAAYDGRRPGGGGGGRRSNRDGSPQTVGTAGCRPVGAPGGTAPRPSCPFLPPPPPYTSTLRQRA